MSEHEQYIIKKEEFAKLVNEINKDSDFIAPVKSDDSKPSSKSFFRKINSANEIFLDKKTYYPAKGLFFKDGETILEFKGNKIKDPKMKLRDIVIFGLRRCDLSGIKHQDIVFLEENTDPFYKARREASLLIGLHCKEGDDYCFCNSIKLYEFFDLMFYDEGKEYALEVGSEKGQRFVNKHKTFFKKTVNAISEQDKKTKNKNILKSLDISHEYNNEKWKEGSDKCLACGACNFICPNCHCFTIEDDINLDLKTGKRIRKQASCQLRHFTRVAGDHIFRDSKLARFKHRIYHQIQYFWDRHGEVFCTGCGRCIEACPSRIDWVNIINKIKDGN